MREWLAGTSGQVVKCDGVECSARLPAVGCRCLPHSSNGSLFIRCRHEAGDAGGGGERGGGGAARR